ncbi:MAG: hypothetical protein SCJ97_04700 [Bacillota bacterium]|nr:hypothetical protein [Bacillota bacterium]
MPFALSPTAICYKKNSKISFIDPVSFIHYAIGTTLPYTCTTVEYESA